MKIRKGDTVFITKGKDRGRKGKVIRVFPKKSRLTVEGVNIRKKNVRPRRQGERGQIVEMPTPFSWANVKMICFKCQKAVRVGYRVEGNKKYRICKKCGGEL